MDILTYIDSQVEYLFSIGVYDYEKDNKRIIEKRDKIKKILEEDPNYSNLSFEEKKNRVDALVNDAINKFIAKKENNDEKREFYSKMSGIAGEGITLLEKKSVTTGEPLEIAYAVIGSGSIHLHCGISRKIDYTDKNGKKITHYHSLLRNLKQYISETHRIEDKKRIEDICSREIIEPYIEEVLENAILLYKKYPHLKTIRLDTNDGFYKQMLPFLNKYGFHECRYQEHLDELQKEFKDYKFPEDLEQFYIDYPDRKNSVTIHCHELEIRLNELKSNKNSIKQY